MKLFETLKRLLEPRARPPVETVAAPTADRPPPPEPEPIPEAASPEVIPAVTSDLSEVRALLEAVAEPEPAESVAEPPAPILPPEPTPTLLDEPTEEVDELPSAVTASVAGALVLTLATPPATFTVAKAAATIGRGQENTIRLDDLSVSRRHARIAYKQGGYWLSDTGSMGGTWVDGTRLNAPYRIGPGQIIDIGLCRLTVSFAGATNADKKETAPKARSEIAAQVRRRR
jgi:pSer/pThr/pTyr-binding forkhead associated (FHA) protein